MMQSAKQRQQLIPPSPTAKSQAKANKAFYHDERRAKRQPAGGNRTKQEQRQENDVAHADALQLAAPVDLRGWGER